MWYFLAKQFVDPIEFRDPGMAAPGGDGELSRLNAVFSGLKPFSAHEFHLAYSVPTGSVNFDAIHFGRPFGPTP